MAAAARSAAARAESGAWRTTPRRSTRRAARGTIAREGSARAGDPGGRAPHLTRASPHSAGSSNSSVLRVMMSSRSLDVGS